MEFTTVQEVNKYYRNMVQTSLAGTVVEMWRDLAFQDKHLVLSGVPDEKSAMFFHDAVKECEIERHLPALCADYLVFGRLAAHLVYDVIKGYWGACIILDHDYYSIKLFPFSAEPVISVESTEQQQEWASSTDSRVVEQRKNLDPTLVTQMARGEAVQLKPMNTLFLARKCFASDFYGTSWLANVREDVDPAKPAELLYKLRVHVAKLCGDQNLQEHYVEAAARLRDRICDYVFYKKMFPFLAKQHGYKLTPTVEWVDKEDAEHPRDIVVRTLEQTGVALAELEERQSMLSWCPSERLCDDQG